MSSKALHPPYYAWVILAVVYLASVAAPLNQYKIPPIMPVIMEQLHLNLTQAGSLMSTIALTGLILALPSGLILQRLGAKASGLLALGCLIAGAGLGAVSHQYPLLNLSRIIEGVGAGLIGVVAPATISLWFPPARQGAAMGIWATWVPVGSVIMYNTAPSLTEAFGWQAVWWFGGGYALFSALLYMFLIRRPPGMEHSPSSANPIGEMKNAYSNKGIWLLTIMFCCFNLTLVSIATYYPTYLNTVLSYPLPKAALYSSVGTFVILFSAPFAGWFSDRIGSRRLMIAVPFLGIAVLMLFPFRVSGWQIPALMIIQGLLVGAIPTATFAATSEVMSKPEWNGLGLALIMVGQYLGQLAGPLFFGEAVGRLGWVTAGYLLIPFCLIGFLCAWSLKIR